MAPRHGGDEESYEEGLGLPNESGEYTTYMKWRREMEENRTIRGRCCWMRYRIWFLLLKFNPYLAGFVTVVVTCGVFFSSLKAGNEDEAAFTQSLLSGTVTMLILQFFSMLADKFSRFPETSRPHIHDETHWSMVAIFLIYIFCLCLAIWALANINEYCSGNKKPCYIKAAFITSN
jgi:hypothetical protein